MAVIDENIKKKKKELAILESQVADRANRLVTYSEKATANEQKVRDLNIDISRLSSIIQEMNDRIKDKQTTLAIMENKSIAKVNIEKAKSLSILNINRAVLAQIREEQELLSRTLAEVEKKAKQNLERTTKLWKLELSLDQRHASLIKVKALLTSLDNSLKLENSALNIKKDKISKVVEETNEGFDNMRKNLHQIKEKEYALARQEEQLNARFAQLGISENKVEKELKYVADVGDVLDRREIQLNALEEDITAREATHVEQSKKLSSKQKEVRLTALKVRKVARDNRLDSEIKKLEDEINKL